MLSEKSATVARLAGSSAILGLSMHASMQLGGLGSLTGALCFLPIIWLVIWILVGIWVYMDAEKRGMSGILWLIIVVLLGPIGLIIYIVVRKPEIPPGLLPPPLPPLVPKEKKEITDKEENDQRIGEQKTIGFVLISTAPAKEHEVYNELLKVKEIVELHPLFGEYDLIAKVEAEDFNVLGQVVVDKIRSIPGVEDTKTLTGIRFGEGDVEASQPHPEQPAYNPAQPQHPPIDDTVYRLKKMGLSEVVELITEDGQVSGEKIARNWDKIEKILNEVMLNSDEERRNEIFSIRDELKERGAEKS